VGVFSGNSFRMECSIFGPGRLLAAVILSYPLPWGHPFGKELVLTGPQRCKHWATFCLACFDRLSMTVIGLHMSRTPVECFAPVCEVSEWMPCVGRGRSVSKPGSRHTVKFLSRPCPWGTSKEENSKGGVRGMHMVRAWMEKRDYFVALDWMIECLALGGCDGESNHDLGPQDGR